MAVLSCGTHANFGNYSIGTTITHGVSQNDLASRRSFVRCKPSDVQSKLSPQAADHEELGERLLFLDGDPDVFVHVLKYLVNNVYPLIYGEYIEYSDQYEY